jgi:membrane protein implicated in regulation of membrane protease activity
MDKFVYWLKKIGMFRSASYSVKGDASNLVEMNAKDGGMIQSQREIDAEYAKKKREKSSGKDEESSEKKGDKKIRILFWIFAVLALLFLIAFLGDGLSFGSLIVMAIWIAFLIYLWQGKQKWASSFATVLVIGLVLVFISFFFFGSSDEDKTDNKEKAVSSETGRDASSESKSLEVESAGKKEEASSSEEKCDDSNSQNSDFNQIEKVIVSENPCKVPWILAKEYEAYTLETKKGTVLQATVFNNYVNNVKAGESYTIRVLDVEEDPTGQAETKAGIAIVRWTPDKNSLSEAKKEVKDVVEELDY